MTPLQTLISENNYKPAALADELNTMRVCGEVFDILDDKESKKTLTRMAARALRYFSILQTL